jgi:hypothetical protein
VTRTDEGKGFDGVSGKAAGHPFIVHNRKSHIDRKRLNALHEFAQSKASLQRRARASLRGKTLPHLRRRLPDAGRSPTPGARQQAERNLLPELRALKEQYGITLQVCLVPAKLHGSSPIMSTNALPGS